MARGKRWTIPFVSLNGTACRVDIYDTDWTGSVTELSTANVSAPGVPDDEPFYYEETDDDSLLNVIRFKTGYINLVETTYNGLIDLYPETDTEHYVEFYYGSRLDFTGYIQAQQFNNDFVAMPRHISLPVISPLGLLGGMNFNVRLTPTILYRDTLLSEIQMGLNAAYEGFMMPDDVPSFRLASHIICPTNDNPGELDGSDAYEPVTYKDFMETFCHLFGLIAHDAPEYIVLSKFNYNDAYTEDGGSGARIYPLTDYFDFASDDHKESLIRPVKDITISYDGSMNFDKSLNLDKTVFLRKAESELSRAAYMQVVNREIVSGHFITYNQAGITNDLPSEKGVMPGCFGGQAQQTDGVLIYYHSAWTPVSTHRIVEFRFYDYPVVKSGDTCILNMSFLRGAKLYNLPGSQDSSPLNFSVDVDGQYYSITDYQWDHSQTVIQGSQLTNGLYMRNVPKGECLTVALYGVGLSDGDLVLITSVRLTAGALEKWMYKYETNNEKVIKGNVKSTESASYNLLFSYDKLNSNAVYDAGETTYTPPDYGYMFLAQNRLDLTMKAKATLPNLYIGKWKYFVDAWRWRMVGVCFYPRDDSYKLTLFRSSTIESSI